MRAQTLLAFLLGILLTLGVVYRGQIFEVIAKGEPFPAQAKMTGDPMARQVQAAKDAVARAERAVEIRASKHNLKVLKAWRSHLEAVEGMHAIPAQADGGSIPVHLKSVEGAPGDGNAALKREVAKALRERGVVMAEADAPCVVIVTAAVAVTPGDKKDSIEIDWSIKTKADATVGSIKQNNTVPTGSLDEAWGKHASYAAQGARKGLMQVLAAVSPTCT